MKKQIRNRRKGFTLLEILITVVIVAVLAAFVIPRMIQQIEKTKQAEALTSLGAIRSAELNLHHLTGKFVAAEDEAAIQSALGLIVGGGFYHYQITGAGAENFLALATPIGPLSDWLQKFGINKDGFVGYDPYSGGGPRVSGGGPGGDSGGSGGVPGGNTGGAGGVPGGSGTNSKQGTTTTVPVAEKPPFAGYTADIQEILNLLASISMSFTSDGLTTAASLAAWIQENEIVVEFAVPPVGATWWGLNTKHWTDGSSKILINAELQANKYAAAATLAHEGMHAIWWQDYAKYAYMQQQAAPLFGVPPDGTIRNTNSIDQEYHAKLTGNQVFYEFIRAGNDVYDAKGYGNASYSDMLNYLNADGSLKPADVGKMAVEEIYEDQNLKDY